MAKLIIKYPDGMSPANALDYVKAVVRKGRKSRARGREQYCFRSEFKGDIVVSAREKAYDDAPDSFVIEEGQE